MVESYFVRMCQDGLVAYARTRRRFGWYMVLDLGITNLEFSGREESKVELESSGGFHFRLFDSSRNNSQDLQHPL